MLGTEVFPCPQTPNGSSLFSFPALGTIGRIQAKVVVPGKLTLRNRHQRSCTVGGLQAPTFAEQHASTCRQSQHRLLLSAPRV